MSDEYDSVEEEVEEVEEDEESEEEPQPKKKRGKKWKVRAREDACGPVCVCAIDKKLTMAFRSVCFFRIRTSPSGPCRLSSCIPKQTDPE